MWKTLLRFCKQLKWVHVSSVGMHNQEWLSWPIRVHNLDPHPMMVMRLVWIRKIKEFKDSLNLRSRSKRPKVDFAPNKLADEEVNKVAQGDTSDAKFLPTLCCKNLPLSISALQQDHMDRIKKRWECRWKSSPREDLLKTIDNSAPSKKYLQLISDLDRCQASILFQLQTGHIGLNQHLFWICKSDTLVCPNCQSIMVESVKHFLLDCPYYQHERHTLCTKLRCNSDSLSFCYGTGRIFVSKYKLL